MARRLQNIVVFLLAGCVTCIFSINFCAWFYRCGCRSLWSGAALYCNIHTPGVRHCPWCSYGVGGYRIALAAILLPQLAISFWGGRSLPARLVLALAAFPVFGAVVAGVYGLISGYWAS